MQELQTCIHSSEYIQRLPPDPSSTASSPPPHRCRSAGPGWDLAGRCRGCSRSGRRARWAGRHTWRRPAGPPSCTAVARPGRRWRGLRQGGDAARTTARRAGGRGARRVGGGSAGRGQAGLAKWRPSHDELCLHARAAVRTQVWRRRRRTHGAGGRDRHGVWVVRRAGCEGVGRAQAQAPRGLVREGERPNLLAGLAHGF